MTEDQWKHFRDDSSTVNVMSGDQRNFIRALEELLSNTEYYSNSDLTKRGIISE